ncbi:MAG: thiol peroxidase [Helicobacteraceae bacterium]|jgi:thiol peroxidase|nr:thiol peroxidase [Helicobacteraceae bacterium]
MKLSALLVLGLLTMTTLNAATTESVTLGGTKVKLVGNMVSVGDSAPIVTLITSDLKELIVGGKTEKTQVLIVVPSIDTPICDMEARTFNTKAAEMPNVAITVISMDLPFAGTRYCAAHGIDNITVASDFQTKAFGKAYGTLMGEGLLQGIEARAVFIIKNEKVTYKQLVPEIKQAPDYEAILKAI